jgi:superoxide reductase
MTKKKQVYKCEVCGNIVEVLHVGGGTLVCCGQNMTLQKEQTADSSTEKHVPVIEKVDQGYKVTVGSTLHPMVDAHFIAWIELLADGKSYRQFLKPGDDPVAFFNVEANEVSAREYCNVHGLWKG